MVAGGITGRVVGGGGSRKNGTYAPPHYNSGNRLARRYTSRQVIKAMLVYWDICVASYTRKEEGWVYVCVDGANTGIELPGCSLCSNEYRTKSDGTLSRILVKMAPAGKRADCGSTGAFKKTGDVFECTYTTTK